MYIYINISKCNLIVKVGKLEEVLDDAAQNTYIYDVYLYV